MIMDKQELIARWIEPHPHRPGPSEVRVKVRGISVWALIGYMKAVDGKIARVAADYAIPPEAVEAAIAYYEDHAGAIDARLAENAA